MALLDNDVDGLKAIDEKLMLDFVLYDQELWTSEKEHIQALIQKINIYLNYIQRKIYLNNEYKDIYKKYKITIIYIEQSSEFIKLMNSIRPELIKKNISIELVDVANLNL